jgi:hypothetical protein
VQIWSCLWRQGRLLRLQKLIVVATGLAMAGCSTSPPAATVAGAPRSTSIYFIEAAVAPVPAVTAGGGVITVRIANTGRSTATISHTDPVADSDLQVTYMGFSRCNRGCAGAGEWNDATARQVEAGLDGRYPLALQVHDRSLSLVFRLETPTDGGRQALTKKCLTFRGAVATLQDGTRVFVTTPNSTPLGGLRWTGAPNGYVDCPQ